MQTVETLKIAFDLYRSMSLTKTIVKQTAKQNIYKYKQNNEYGLKKVTTYYINKKQNNTNLILLAQNTRAKSQTRGGFCGKWVCR